MEEDEGLKIFVVMVREISKELKIFTQSCKQIEMSIARGSVVMFSLFYIWRDYRVWTLDSSLPLHIY